MFTSIKAGISAAADLQPGDGGYFLMLVDCPLVPPEVVELIWKKHEENPEAFIVPAFAGKKDTLYSFRKGMLRKFSLMKAKEV